MKTANTLKSAITFAVVLLLGLTGAQADTFELDLFSLGCPTEFTTGPEYWTSDFDLGIEFTEINHVYMDWSGEITGGLVQYLDPQTLEPIGEPSPLDVGVYASLGSNPYLRSTAVLGGGITYPDPEPFDELSEFELVGPSTWSDLLDGEGTIGIQYTELIILDGYYVEHGSVTLSSANLIVDGVPVPEPATILLITIGIAAVRGRCRKTSHEL